MRKFRKILGITIIYNLLTTILAISAMVALCCGFYKALLFVNIFLALCLFVTTVFIYASNLIFDNYGKENRQ